MCAHSVCMKEAHGVSFREGSPLEQDRNLEEMRERRRDLDETDDSLFQQLQYREVEI